MTTTSNTPTTALAKHSGTIHRYQWHLQSRSITATYEVMGTGSPVLLLPALSTVSTREEWYGLAAQLVTAKFQAIALDWIGFGASDRPAIAYKAEVYRQFLHDFVRDTFSAPVAVVAAGHAAGYVMHWALHQPPLWSKIALVAPTWRGPLPTMGASSQVANAVQQLVRSPLLGPVLYKLNTTPAFLRFMYRRHVYENEANLTPELIDHKYRITQQPGARFAPAAFVTGALDPFVSRDEFLAPFQALSMPALVIVGTSAPPGSTAEMEALNQFSQLDLQHLPGSLGLHEEYADAVARVMLPFLQANMS